MEILIDTPWVKELIKSGEVDVLKAAMEQSTEVGGQTFDQSLFALYADGLITEQHALANADSANNLRIRIKNLELSRKTSRDRRAAESLEGEPFRIEGASQNPWR